MSNKQNGQAPKGNSQPGETTESQVSEGQGGKATGVEELQAQLADVTAERDALAAKLDEATAKLQAAAAPAKSGNEGKGTHIRVCSKSPGGSHRRAGHVWTAQAVDVPLKDLSKEQLAQLRSCPLTLVIDL